MFHTPKEKFGLNLGHDSDCLVIMCRKDTKQNQGLTITRWCIPPSNCDIEPCTFVVLKFKRDPCTYTQVTVSEPEKNATNSWTVKCTIITPKKYKPQNLFCDMEPCAII